MMKAHTSRAMAGAAALAIVGGLLVAGGGAASAATAPPWEPDPTSSGGLSFYNAAGVQITGGNITDAPFAAYVQASAPDRAGDTKATLFGYLPKNGVAIGAWSGEAMTASTNYPNATAPGALATSTLPVVTLGGSDETVAVLAGDLPNTATDSYQGLYQLRLKTSAAGVPAGTAYNSADILITGSTWTQVYPTVKVSTATAINASPTSPAAHGSTVSLTATVTGGGSSHPAGAVEFFDGATDIGAGAFVAATGIATKSVVPADGAHSFTAVFTPTDPTSYTGSTSVALPYTVNAVVPAATTSTALSVNPTSAPAFSTVALHANVTKTSDSSVVGAGGGAVLIHQENPSCGDQIDLQIVFEDAHLKSIRFTSQGCAISRASASMMTMAVEGKTVEEIRQIITEFQSMLIKDVDLPDELGDLEALRSVRKFPTRIKCATLAWHALEKLLNDNETAKKADPSLPGSE